MSAYPYATDSNSRVKLAFLLRSAMTAKPLAIDGCPRAVFDHALKASVT